MSFTIQKSKYGKPHIIYDNFKFRQSYSIKAGDITWRCLGKICNATIKTNSDKSVILFANTQHSGPHPVTMRSLTSPSSSSSPSLVASPCSDASIGLATEETPHSDMSLTLPAAPVLDSMNCSTPATSRDGLQLEILDLKAENKRLKEELQVVLEHSIESDTRLLEYTKDIFIAKPSYHSSLNFNNNPPTDTIICSSQQSVITVDSMSQPATTFDAVTIAASAVSPPATVPAVNTLHSQTQNNSCESGFLKGIHVIEAEMGDFIDTLRHNPNIAFAHSISKDFNHFRHMTAGVAVTFKRKFGKPNGEDCLTEHLVYQQTEGAGVYSLVTKPVYYGKPTEAEYDTAFEDLMQDMKRKDFKTLICSPLGCVRDQIKLEHFVRNIVKTYQITGATILIVTKNQQAGRALRNGISQVEFIKQLRRKIKQAMNTTTKKHNSENGGECRERVSDGKYHELGSPRDKLDWYKMTDEDMKLFLEQIQLPENTLMLDLAVSHLFKIKKDSKETAEMLKLLAVDSYEYILAVVNDREEEDKEGGTHWSLLMYTRDDGKFYHLDSLDPLNLGHAQRLAAALSGDPHVSVYQLQCSRQVKNVECGAYVLHYSEIICTMIKNKINVKDSHCYKQNFLVDKIYENIQNFKRNKVKYNNEVANPIRKVTLLSDSHGRGLRRLLHDRLSENCEVVSVVKPGAKFDNVASGGS